MICPLVFMGFITFKSTVFGMHRDTKRESLETLNMLHVVFWMRMYLKGSDVKIVGPQFGRPRLVQLFGRLRRCGFAGLNMPLEVELKNSHPLCVLLVTEAALPAATIPCHDGHYPCGTIRPNKLSTSCLVHGVLSPQYRINTLWCYLGFGILFLRQNTCLTVLELAEVCLPLKA